MCENDFLELGYVLLRPLPACAIFGKRTETVVRAQEDSILLVRTFPQEPIETTIALGGVHGRTNKLEDGLMVWTARPFGASRRLGLQTSGRVGLGLFGVSVERDRWQYRHTWLMTMACDTRSV